MGSPPGDKNGYRLAYEIALRAIDEQRSTLAEVRQRANNLLAIAFGAGGIIASIIFTSAAAKNITNPGLAGIFLAALGSAGVFGCTVFIWRVTKGWGFNVNAVGMVVQVNDGTDEARILHDQAVHIGKAVRENRKKLKRRLRAFNTGLWFMLAETAGLSMLIGDVAYA